MSELKVHRIIGLDERCARVDNDYYLKSEADAVIAELKHQVWEADERAIDAGATCHEKMQESDHHKYKRCLAMAMWCEEVDLFGGYTSNYWMRWRNKWLELAEKFKPNSTAQ